MSNRYDCIVVGGGHAGAEAAWASSRLGAETLLITLSKETIAKMSCNPAIGGIGKGQLVREVDAMGGLMGLAIDRTGIQFRLLNRSKGPAVHSPRAQADKYAYSEYICRMLESAENLTIVEVMAGELIIKDNRCAGIRCVDGREYTAGATVLTAGTFLNGIMHCGNYQWPGGRLDEPSADSLGENLRSLPLKVGRLKTGTPVRLAGDTIDYDKCELQPGDDTPLPFSFMNDTIDQLQVPCWITYTNPQMHRLLIDNMDKAPLYTGQIESTGPRYCPSIETKVLRFADKNRHQVFLEPEDRAVSTIYCNGISTSYPKDIQQQMLKMIPGTENARIVHYAYAIEYDFCPANQLKMNLESRAIEGLFMAGQINGTTGYEEAAALGMMAGINMVRKLDNADHFVLGRDKAYIGVMIDDLLTREIDEPYRMFTSRAEYRLSLRSDNADRRLTQIGRSVGLVDDKRYRKYQDKIAAIEKMTDYLKAARQGDKSLYQVLKQPDNSLVEDLRNSPGFAGMGFTDEIIQAVAVDAKYEGYLARQEKQIAGFRNLERIKLPLDLDYGSISHLRFEAKEKLSAVRPYTLGQAGRIGGITPADLTVIQIHLKKIKGS